MAILTVLIGCEVQTLALFFFGFSCRMKLLQTNYAAVLEWFSYMTFEQFIGQCWENEIIAERDIGYLAVISASVPRLQDSPDNTANAESQTADNHHHQKNQHDNQTNFK